MFDNWILVHEPSHGDVCTADDFLDVSASVFLFLCENRILFLLPHEHGDCLGGVQGYVLFFEVLLIVSVNILILKLNLTIAEYGMEGPRVLVQPVTIETQSWLGLLGHDLGGLAIIGRLADISHFTYY